jgi:hypothetical protein
VLVTFPAASTIFTDPDRYDLSNTQYGLLFLPQVATAITASLPGASLGGRFGTKRVYLAGLASGLVSMLLLIFSQFVESNTSVAFPLLLVATAFLGAGFGLTVPSLNTLTAAFHPAAVGRWVPVRTTYRVLPFLLAVTFVVIALLPDGATGAGVLAFGLAGLGCSALLPLTIGFGEEELAAMAAAVAGGVIASYQLGYGIAAFGVGPLLDAGVSLSTIYGFSAIVAVAMGVASFGVTRVREAQLYEAREPS